MYADAKEKPEKIINRYYGDLFERLHDCSEAETYPAPARSGPPVALFDAGAIRVAEITFRACSESAGPLAARVFIFR